MDAENRTDALDELRQRAGQRATMRAIVMLAEAGASRTDFGVHGLPDVVIDRLAVMAREAGLTVESVERPEVGGWLNIRLGEPHDTAVIVLYRPGPDLDPDAPPPF